MYDYTVEEDIQHRIMNVSSDCSNKVAENCVL